MPAVKPFSFRPHEHFAGPPTFAASMTAGAR